MGTVALCLSACTGAWSRSPLAQIMSARPSNSGSETVAARGLCGDVAVAAAQVLDECRRASCYGHRARLVRRGAVGKGPQPEADRRQGHVRVCGSPRLRYPGPPVHGGWVRGSRVQSGRLSG